MHLESSEQRIAHLAAKTILTCVHDERSRRVSYGPDARIPVGGELVGVE